MGHINVFLFFFLLFLIQLSFIIYSIYAVSRYFKTDKEVFLLPLLFLISIYYFMNYIYYSINYVGLTNYVSNFSYIKVALLLFVSILVFLLYIKKFYPSRLILLLISFRLFVFPLIEVYVESKIGVIAWEKYHVRLNSSNISIDFNVNDDFRHPHATFNKDGKTYHWSFKANDFIE